MVEAAAEAPDEVTEPEPEPELEPEQEQDPEPEELAEESSAPPANIPYLKDDTHF